MNTIQEVLHELGSSELEVVESLKLFEIKGKPVWSIGCPIAKYLHLRGYLDVDVSRWNITVYGGWEGEVYRANQDVETPKPIHDFIDRFDRGDYPELIEEEKV